MIYLNNAATTYPKPQSVLDAVSGLLGALPLNHGRGGGDHGTIDPGDIIELCRRDLAELFSIKDPKQIVFTSGSTDGLNGIFHQLFQKGDRVVATAIDHNSVLRPLFRLEKHGIITLDILPCDHNGRISPESILNAIENGVKPKAVVINHLSNVLGTEQDLHAIGAITQKNGVLLIADVSQSAGVVDIDVDAMKIDLMAFTAHKSLYGIQGSGGIYIRQGINFEPWRVGGTGIKGGLKEQPTQMPLLYEAGTPNTPGIMALMAGIAYINEHTILAMTLHKKKWVKELRERLKDHSEITLYGDATTVLAFNIKGMIPGEVTYMLRDSFDIVVRGGLHCAPLIYQYISAPKNGVVRISPSHLSTHDDLEAIYEAICTIIEMG